MQYLLDTVTVIRHFGATGRLGKGAKDILGRIDQGIDPENAYLMLTAEFPDCS